MRGYVALLSTLALSCQATTSANLSAKSTGKFGGGVESQANGEVESSGAIGTSAQTTSKSRPGTTAAEDDSLEMSPSPGAGPGAGRPALFGARASLHLAPPHSPVCRCVSVAVGMPDSARMKWESGSVKSSIDPSRQLALALGSAGIDCPGAPKDSEGASYQGYQVQGSDVIVMLEVARLGRPIAEGAIIPRPFDGGRLLVRPVDKKTPYGLPLDGGPGDCVVPLSP